MCAGEALAASSTAWPDAMELLKAAAPARPGSTVSSFVTSRDPCDFERLFFGTRRRPDLGSPIESGFFFFSSPTGAGRAQKSTSRKSSPPTSSRTGKLASYGPTFFPKRTNADQACPAPVARL